MADHEARDERRRPPVMADVAKLAGVSHQTVSRVINESTQVRPETRERVLDAMRKLDYRPNSLARALATGRSRTLGVVSFDTVLYGPGSTLFGIHRAAHEEDYFISTVSLRRLDRASFLGAVDRLRMQGVEGILVIAPQTDAAYALLQLPREVPLVAVEAGPAGGVPVVAVDHVAGAAAATSHLLELGHETVWHVSGPTDWVEAQERVSGWRAALQAAAADIPEPLLGNWSPGAGYELGKQLAADPDVTAIFVANDQMALGLLRALHEAGRLVPRDVSVVGFDDIPEAAYFTPPLTTVRQDFIEVGRQAFHLVLREIERASRSTERITVPAELVVRASTAAP
jgi:DNA-binding LacI/PurR family transcriptional regulator